MTIKVQQKVQQKEQTIVLPAADAQVRLWFIHQLLPTSPVYNIYRAIRIKGDFDPIALEKSVNALIERQAILRTTFSEEDGEVLQTIHPRLSIKLDIKDLSSLKEKESKLTQLLDNGVQTPFNLVDGPLIRVTLFKLDDEDHVFFFEVHHLIFDRRSLGLLNKKLSYFYQYFSKGKKDELLPLEVSFADYTRWRLDKFNEQDLSKQWKYWEKNLKDITPLELPYDGRRTSVPSTEGDRSYLDLPNGLINDFEKAVSKHGVTLFMGLLSVFKLLIYRWSGQTDIITGTPFADRRMKGTEELFGFFVSTLILRADLSGEPTFSELLTRVRKTCFNSYRYNSMPLDQIINKLNPERIVNRNPLFDLDFQLQKLQPEPLTLGDTVTTECRASRKSSQYDLGFTIREKETSVDGIADYDIRFEYRTDLFSEKTIKLLLQRFVKLLKQVTLDQTKKIDDYSILLPEEKQNLLIKRNENKLDYPQQSMHQFFINQVIENPDKYAVITENNKFTYKDIAIKACVIANELENQGVQKGDVIGILLNRSELIPVAMLASFFVGASYLPLDPEYPESRIEYILDDASVKYILLEESLSGQVSNEMTKKLFPEELLKGVTVSHTQFEKSIERYKLADYFDQLAYIIYTSGSTGNPKGVMLTQKNLVSFISAMKKTPGMDQSDTLLAVTTISFDISVLEILLPLSIGASTVVVNRNSSYDPVVLEKLLQDTNATIMQATPATWQMMVTSGWKGKKDLKLLTGGEALSQKLADQLVPLVKEVWNMYGPTETTVWSSCYQVKAVGQTPLIGKAIANTQIYVLDKSHQPVVDGAYGELCIAGDGVSDGYFGRDDLTEKVFIDNPFYKDAMNNSSMSSSKKLYKTGDLVRFNQLGLIEYIGRMDFQVKVRGYRIELGEIETAIGKQKGIDGAVVIVREDIIDDKRIVAYMTANDEDISVDELRIALQDRLPNYMIPQNFVFLESFPQTPNGKVDRKSLPIPEMDGMELQKDIVLPKTDTEKAIAELWREFSGHEDISIDSNFFEIGGHSLLAMQVISRAKKELDINIKPMAMIQDTLAQIAASIDGVDFQSSSVEKVKTNSVQPKFFGDNNSLFGYFYKANSEQFAPNSNGEINQKTKSKGAVLLCSPILLEKINANWAYRRLATQLSNEGFDVLRFDYYGCGDSLGYDNDGHVQRWIKDIAEASAFLQTQSRHEKISIIGLRFGASLAAEANIPFVDNLILWEPIFNGEQYVEELYKKYKNTLKDLNYIRKDEAKMEPEQLVGFAFSKKLEQSIRDNRLLNGENLNNAQRVLLVSSNSEHPYNCYLGDFKKLINKKSQFEYCFVDDSSPGIEKYDDLSAFLPGKILSTIVKELNKA